MRNFQQEQTKLLACLSEVLRQAPHLKAGHDKWVDQIVKHNVTEASLEKFLAMLIVNTKDKKYDEYLSSLLSRTNRFNA